MKTDQTIVARHLAAATHYLVIAFIMMSCSSNPQPLTGGEVTREVLPDGSTTIKGKSTGDPCGPPPANLQSTDTTSLDAKLLDYVKAGGKVESLAGVTQVLKDADLSCDAFLYRACKVCFTNNKNSADCN